MVRSLLTQPSSPSEPTPERGRAAGAPSAAGALREMVRFASGDWSAGAAPRAAAELVAAVTGSEQVLVLRRAETGDEVAGEVGTGLRIGEAFSGRNSRLRESAEVRVGDRTWGEIRAVQAHPDVAIAEMAGLVSRVLAAVERRAVLVDQKVRDPLTGLTRVSVFQEGLARALRHSDRHDQPLSLILMEIDPLGESDGSRPDDRTIVRAAGELVEAARSSDLLSRLAEGRFAWVMSGADGAEATDAAFRVRDRLAGIGPDAGDAVTASFGVAEWAGELSSDDLLASADAALYESRRAGGDRVSRSRRVAGPTAGGGDAPAHSQALIALRALARAVDAKDPSTNRHSSRVALVAERLAEEVGWAAEDLRRIADAGLLHDVGKLLVADEILAKPGPLTDDEYREVMRHPGAGAEIASEVLDDDQTSWIRHHHERWDGTGYPDRVTGPAIPHGARLLAVADAWDVMTQARHYRDPLSREDALAELRDGAGTQFDPQIAAALVDLVERGGLDHGSAD